MKNSEELIKHWELDLFTKLPTSRDAGILSGIHLLEDGVYHLDQLMLADPKRRIILSDQTFGDLDIKHGDTLNLTWTFNFEE